MLDPNAMLDGPIPGQSLTHELGARPWQQPAQYTTVEDTLDYYIPRLDSDEVSEQLINVLEMGIPVTTIANTMQLGGVMEGKHSVDVGMLILPVLIELIMLIGDAAKVDYVSGLEKEKKLDSSLIDLAVTQFNKQKDKEVEVKEEIQEPVEERTGGLMSRSL
tara:strand:+ start:2366 stop:2851 length:486 start_codon:yes stop_codon:yes gene_type:complete